MGDQISIYDQVELFFIGLLSVCFLVGLWYISKTRSAVHRLKSEIANRDMITSTVTHDLKNPLSVIKAYSEILRSKDRAVSDVLSRETGKMMRLIDEMVNYAKLQKGTYRLHKELLDLTQLVKIKCITLSQVYPKSSIACAVNDERRRWVMADKVAIDRVLVNVIINAVRHSPDKTPIKVSIDDSYNSHYVIKIKDKGDGIPEEVQPYIFEPFTQGNGTHGESGLGLYITRTLLQMHGGNILFETKPGKETTFFISLPKSQPQK